MRSSSPGAHSLGFVWRGSHHGGGISLGDGLCRGIEAVLATATVGETISVGLIDVLCLGVKLGVSCLIFMGVGAMTDFGPDRQPAQEPAAGRGGPAGHLHDLRRLPPDRFSGPEAGSIGIIGGADGPTAIFVTVMLAPALLGTPSPCRRTLHGSGAGDPAAHYEAADHRGRAQDRYEAPAGGLQKEKIVFPIVVTVFVALLVPSAAPLIACLMLGNLFRGVRRHRPAQQDGAERAHQHRHHLPGVSVGATATGNTFLSPGPGHHGHGLVAFSFGTAGGVLLAKFMNLFLKEKINPSSAPPCPPCPWRPVCPRRWARRPTRQLPADARHGPQRGWRHRLRHRRGCADLLFG